MLINIGDLLARRARLIPDREAVVCEDHRYTWAEANQRVNRVCHAMRRLGIGYGDRVGLLALNEPEYLDLFYGLGKIGAILVPINYRLAGPEMAYMLQDSGVKAFVFGPEYVDLVDSFRSDIPAEYLIALGDEPPEWALSFGALAAAETAEEPALEGGDDDVLTILYTSGTTGKPKGAMLTHNNYFMSATNLLASIGDLGETALLVLPLFHIGGIGNVPLGPMAGVRVVMLKSLDPRRMLELIHEEKINVFGSVPALLQILKIVPDFEKYDWSSVRKVFVYAAPLPVALLEEYDKAGIEVRNLYGMTESTGSGTVIDGEHSMLKAGSCGPPEFLADVRVLDDDGNEVGPEELGEVVMRGDFVMKGYWNNPEATAETIVDGWLHTGDIARRDADGYFYIMDRKKDMIISGGENIYPAELEDVIMHHSKVADVGVIGYPDEMWGSASTNTTFLGSLNLPIRPLHQPMSSSAVSSSPGVTTTTAHTDSPRTPTGKILKRVLREQYE